MGLQVKGASSQKCPMTCSHLLARTKSHGHSHLQGRPEIVFIVDNHAGRSKSRICHLVNGRKRQGGNPPHLLYSSLQRCPELSRERCGFRKGRFSTSDLLGQRVQSEKMPVRGPRRSPRRSSRRCGRSSEPEECAHRCDVRERRRSWGCGISLRRGQLCGRAGFRGCRQRESEGGAGTEAAQTVSRPFQT